jgi:hypothetical protein
MAAQARVQDNLFDLNGRIFSKNPGQCLITPILTIFLQRDGLLRRAVL